MGVASLAAGLPRSHSLFTVGPGGALFLGGSSGCVFVFDLTRRRAAPD